MDYRLYHAINQFVAGHEWLGQVARLRMGAKCRDCLTERRPVGDVGGLTADRNRERGATSPADKRPSDERDDCGQESQWENFYWLRVGELRLSHVGLR
jgi:hypothetical protein